MSLGNRALVTVAGSILVLMKVPVGDVPMHRLQDIRILPVCFDAQGQRRREFNLSVAIMDGTPPGGVLAQRAFYHAQFVEEPVGSKFHPHHFS